MQIPDQIDGQGLPDCWHTEFGVVWCGTHIDLVRYLERYLRAFESLVFERAFTPLS